MYVAVRVAQAMLSSVALIEKCTCLRVASTRTAATISAGVARRWCVLT